MATNLAAVIDSSGLINFPNEKRTVLAACCSVSPIDVSTCDGIESLALHAEPVDACNPILSNAITNKSASILENCILNVPGTQIGRAHV